MVAERPEKLELHQRDLGDCVAKLLTHILYILHGHMSWQNSDIWKTSTIQTK